MSSRHSISSIRTCLEVLRSHHAQVVDTEHKAYCIENIGLSRPVQPGNRVETLVPALYKRCIEHEGKVNNTSQR